MKEVSIIGLDLAKNVFQEYGAAWPVGTLRGEDGRALWSADAPSLDEAGAGCAASRLSPALKYSFARHLPCGNIGL